MYMLGTEFFHLELGLLDIICPTRRLGEKLKRVREEDDEGESFCGNHLYVAGNVEKQLLNEPFKPFHKKKTVQT